MKNPIRCLCFISFLLLYPGATNAQSETNQAVVDRYEQLLLSSSQPGASFDRVVEWYSTQGGGLESLQQRWEKNAADPSRRRALLILQGLLAEKLHEIEKARAFYLEALADGHEPAQSARLLAVLETTEGHFPAAAEAYQKALASETLAPVDRMELMRSLALLYQRAFEDEKAIAVWREAISRFPEDTYVLEEAGEAFLSAGNFDDARQTFTKLRDLSASDPFRKIAASLRLARTSELEGKTDEAVRIYDLSLAETSEGSWINREVRTRVEELFRRKDDLPGLLAYYEKRTTDVPQDYQSFAAQAVVLDDLGRGSDAIERSRTASKLAPENLELRLALIQRLNRDGQLDGALVEAEELAKPADAPLEVLLTLGDLHWANFEQTGKDEARENALTAWQRIAPDASSDLARISRLAEIYTAHNQADLALAQWQRIIALSPAAVDARQKVAEIFVKRNDRPAALAVLEDLVKGDRAQADNFLQLARLQERLQFSAESRATGIKALGLFPQNYEVLNFVWRQAVEDKDARQVENLFLPLWKNAPNEFFSDDAVKRYVSYLQSAGLDQEKSKALQERLKAGESVELVEALVLLRLALAQQDEEAARQAFQILNTQNNPTRTVHASAEIAQAFGTPEEQIVALKEVAAVDPRNAQDNLQAVARIQASSGKIDEALLTIAQLIERSPADGALYSFYAEIASQAGKNDLAIARLREATRYVENATNLRLQLADLLQSQSQNAEAEKVLQESFQKEDQEGRRMEIFRRQIELATAMGTLDNLIAGLKAKQASEQNGARYGAYLAEIYLQQNDLLAASEELKRSLGHNPADPTAVARLLDLADRGGDQPEAVRLAERLVEVKPSVENRAAYISRLFETRDLTRAQAELEKVRPEIIQDFTGWSPLLTAMRRAGLSTECDAIAAEVAALPTTSAAQRYDLATLYVSQRNYDTAEKILWTLVEDEGLSATLAAIAAQPINRPGYNGDVATFQLLTVSYVEIAQDVQNTLQQNFANSSYRGSSRSFGGRTSSGKSNLTPGQNAQIKSIYVLSTLAGARQQVEAFRKRIKIQLDRDDIPTRIRAAVLSSLGDQASLVTMAQQQAADPNGSVEMDKFFIGMAYGFGPELKEVMEALQARVALADPAFAFSQLLNKTYSEMAQQNLLGPEKELDPAVKKQFQEKLNVLLQHPGLGAEPIPRLMLANLAGAVGDLKTGWRLVDETEDRVTEILQKPGPNTPYVNQHWQSAYSGLLIRTINTGSPEAESRLEKFLAKQISSVSPFTISMARGITYRGRGINLILQSSPTVLIGDPAFPAGIFQMLTRTFSTPQNETTQNWFLKKNPKADLDIQTLGAYYTEWFAGKQDDAIKRLEAVHGKHPTSRSAALLLEAYEKNNQPEKALAMLGTADLQEGETSEIRSIRQIRLLRLADRDDEARELGEKLVGGRFPTELKQFLIAELNELGVSTTKLQTSSRGISSSSRSSQGYPQIEKLIAAKKMDETERIAASILNKPLPPPNDQNEINIRGQMIRSLRSIMRLGNLEKILQERATKDPGDLDAIIRLTELSLNSDNRAPVDRLIQAIHDHPASTNGIGYILEVMRNNSRYQKDILTVSCALLETGADNFFAAGLQMQDLRNLTSQNYGDSVLLATTIDHLDAGQYQKLFTPSRISRQMEEGSLLTLLADSADQAGKPELAISLLKKSLLSADENYSKLPVSLRLAELQIAQDHKEDAAGTMRQLIEDKTGGFTRFYGGGMSSFGNILTNLISNRVNNGGGDLLNKLGDLATTTGTLDLLVQNFEATAPKSTGISQSLIFRTMMGRPDVAREWRVFLKSDAALPPEFFRYGIIATIVRQLSAEPDAAKLLPAFLRKLPEKQYGYGGTETALRTLAETLPFLAKYKEDATVRKHVALLMSAVTKDPNSAQNLLYSQSYASALNSLLEQSYTAEARTLFAQTAAARMLQNYSNRPALLRIETILTGLNNPLAELQILCAASPLSAEELSIRWKIDWKIEADPDSASPMPGWDVAAPSIPTKILPTALEIFAGPNPASLKKIKEINRPKTSGNLEAKVTSPLGLLQARWKYADGRISAGPLTAYVIGENLIKQNGVPDPVDGKPNPAFQTGVAGPLGEKSAINYEGFSARSEVSFSLADLPKDEDPQTIVFCGWVKAASFSGQTPSFNMRFSREIGKSGGNNIGHDSTTAGQWHQLFRVWRYNKSESNQTADARQILLDMKLNSSVNYNSVNQISGAWDGLQLVVLKGEPPLQNSSGLFISAAQDASAKNDYGKACASLLSAFSLDANAVSEQGTWVVETFEKANRLPELYQLLTNPSLYLKDPLRDRQVTVRDESLLALLTEKAASAEAPPSAQKWLEVVQNVSSDARLRFNMQSVSLQKQFAAHPGKIDSQQILATLGFSANGINSTRVRELWNFTSSSQPALRLLEIAERKKLEKSMLELLQKSNVSVDLLAARQMLSAWLTAAVDPAKSLQLWRQSFIQRRNQNSANFSNEADLAFIKHLAQTNLPTVDLVAAIKNWSNQRQPDQQQRILRDIFYAAANVESPRRDEYFALWTEAEFSTLKSSDADPSGGHVLELAKKLSVGQDWKRLDELFQIAATNRVLKDASWQRDLARIKENASVESAKVK